MRGLIALLICAFTIVASSKEFNSILRGKVDPTPDALISNTLVYLRCGGIRMQTAALFVHHAARSSRNADNNKDTDYFTLHTLHNGYIGANVVGCLIIDSLGRPIGEVVGFKKKKIVTELSFSPYIRTRSVGGTLAYGPSCGRGTEAIIAGWREDNTKVIKHVTILGVVGVTTLVSIQSFAGECVQYGNRNQNAIDLKQGDLLIQGSAIIGYLTILRQPEMIAEFQEELGMLFH